MGVSGAQRDLLIRRVLAAVMSVDMYGRVKARLTEAGGSPQRAKVS